MAGRRGGRPWGPIRAESEEAKALATFLRAQVDASGKTLKTLADEIHLSKTQISERLAGKVPDQTFVTALLRATIREPRLRERHLTKANDLLRAAAHPVPTKPPSPAAPLELAAAQAQQVEIYDRLTRSLEQQNQLREAAGNSARLVMVLLAMINELERRITGLTSERDQLRAAHAESDTQWQTQQQLTRAHEQEQRAQHELLRAREKQRQAEELATRVQAQVDQLTDELDRLRSGNPHETSREEVSAGQDVQTADPVGDDIDAALTRAAAVNDQDDQVLQRITHALIPDASVNGVVPDNPPDNPVPGPTSADNLSFPQAEAARWKINPVRLSTRLSSAIRQRVHNSLIHRGPTRAVAFSPNGDLLATVGRDKTVRLWNPYDGQQISSLAAGVPFVVAFSPDEDLLATAGRDKRVRLWRPHTGKQVGDALAGHTTSVFAVAFSPRGGLLATADQGKTVRFWEPRTQKQVGAPLTAPGAVYALAFSPRGDLLATAGGTSKVQLWDPRTRKRVDGPLADHAEPVPAVAFSPAGDLLAIADGTRKVWLWDPIARKQVGAPLLGHSRRVSALAFSADGDLLATASEDRTMRLWDPRTQKQVGAPFTHASKVSAVAFSPHGDFLASASRDGVRLWS